MIVTTPKPLDELLDFLSPYTNILVAGCDGCTQPPRGLREAKTLSQLLELGGKLRNKNFTFKVTTVAKQCDNYLAASILRPQINGAEAVLSLACGIAVTGGICPVARCSKGLLNGACGGSKEGKCELNPEKDCAWILIYEQLKKMGKLELLKEFHTPRDYQLSGWKVTP